jgi:hypothetical protein
LGGRSRQISEFKASLVYRVSSRTARAIREKPCLEKKKGKERKGKERKGKERKGKERKGKERKGKERKNPLYCFIMLCSICSFSDSIENSVINYSS